MPAHNEGLSLDDSVLLTGLTKDEVMFFKDNEDKLRSLITEVLRHDASVATLTIYRGDIRSYTIEYVKQF